MTKKVNTLTSVYQTAFYNEPAIVIPDFEKFSSRNVFFTLINN